MRDSNIFYMDEAIKEAFLGASLAEVPVGCVAVDSSGTIVARSHNLTNEHRSPLAHAEVNVLRHVLQHGLAAPTDLTIFVTIEPCIMCAFFLLHCGVRTVVYGADNPKFGGVRTVFPSYFATKKGKMKVVCGVRAKEIAKLLEDFFEYPNPHNRRP